MEKIKIDMLKQAKTCLVTSLLYHDMLEIMSEDNDLILFIKSIKEKRSFNGNVEVLLLMLAFFHYGVLKENPEFMELKKFFRESGGNYDKDNYSELKNVFNKLWNNKKNELEEWILNEKLQTNEIGRCSIIYPAILSLGLNKINLIELGCSAGLILFMDLYSYHYSDNKENFIKDNHKPVLKCITSDLNKIEKLFSNKSEIVKRIGFDLNIPNLNNEENVIKLKSALWDDVQRKERLEQAIDLFKEKNNHLNLLTADYTEDLTKTMNDLIDKDSDIVFYSSVSTYQIPDNIYTKLVDNLESLSKSLKKDIYFIEYESVRNIEHKKEITPDEYFHVTINKYSAENEKLSYQFAKAHFHGKSLTILK